jgi:hypothetical protein
MAAIDPSIALGVKPIQIENPMNQYAALSQIQAGQNQNALAQYQLSSAKRADEKVNFLNQSISKNTNPETGQINYSGVYKDAVQNNFGSLIPELKAKEAEAQGKEIINKKNVADTVEKNLKLIREKTADLINNPSPENIKAHAQDGLIAGAWSQQQADAFVQKSLSLPPAQRVAFFKEQSLDAEKRITTAETNRANLEREKVAKGNLAVNQAQLGVSQANLAINQDKAKRDKTMGTIPSGYRLSADGNSLELIPGGPSAVILAPKEIQKREAVLPQARQAVKTVSNTMSVIGDTVDALLKNEKGINGITGLIYGNTLAITDEARKAKADLETLKNLAFVQGITELRNASKTGAGVGNVTNREGDRFENMKASLDRSQSKDDLITSLKKLKQQAQLTSQFTNEAFDETYSYKNNAEPMQPPPVNSAAPVSPTEKKPSLKEIFTAPIKQQ